MLQDLKTEVVHSSSEKNLERKIFFHDDFINKACSSAKRSPPFVDESGFSSENLGNFTFVSNLSGSFGRK